MIALEPLAQAESAETALVAPPMTERARFFRFLVTGGIAAGVNVLSRWLLDFVVVYEIAVGLAYIAGMTTAFVLARMFVFEREAGDAKGQYFRFALVNVVAFIQVWCVSVGLARLVFPAIRLTWQAETIAHVIGVVSPVAMSYLAHKKFSFRSVRKEIYPCQKD
jgi:putative flippase GtrA